MAGIEDKIIDTLIDNEYLLFPEEAANIDTESLKAFEEMYDYDMKTNKDILGDVDFEDYLKSFNTKLIEQRGSYSEGSDVPYVGPIRDLDNNVEKKLSSLKISASNFNNDYQLLKTSAIRAFDSISKMNRELPGKIEDTKNQVKSNMLSE